VAYPEKIVILIDFKPNLYFERMELDWINLGFKFATDFTLKKEVITTV